MSEKKYYRFIELDPWKGETHHYYIPTTSEAIPKLAEFCKSAGTFELQSDFKLDEETVKHAMGAAAASLSAIVIRVNLPRTRPIEPKDLRNGAAFTCQQVNELR